MRPFYSVPYPPWFFMGGCNLGWKIRLVFFRLIRIPQTVHEWRLQIFAFDSLGVWGWLTLLPCASATGAVTFFQSHMTFFNLESFKTHTPVYIWVPPWCTPKYVPRTIFLNTNKDSHVQNMIVFLEANFKSDNRPEPVDTLGISTSSYYFPRPLMGP